MDSYWDLYVAYVHHCVEYNKRHDIDPHHYEMEWNHFLPVCLFEDQPIGHYLLLRQHAIASALQTLAFRQNCLCGWHKKHLPITLIALAWPYYRKRQSLKLKARHRKNTINGKSVLGLAQALKWHELKDERGKSLLGLQHARRLHENKDTTGKSLVAIALNEKIHAEKDERGRSLLAMRVNSQRWECLVTGKITSAGPLTRWQKARGIDTSLRIRRKDREV